MGLGYVDVIVDLQSGDTGKGKVAHHLAKTGNYDYVLRYNGGSNAGHTVYHDGVKIVTHQVPVGVLHGIKSIIGLGCVVNIPKLEIEINELQAAGINTKGLLFIDKRAHLVTDTHLVEDASEKRIGTTRQGIGPAYRDKYARTGLRAESIKEHEMFQVIDVYKLFFKHKQNYNVLLEGAQGFNLDIDWGDYPYVTSSHCTIGSACLNGIPPHKLRKIYGVMKAYETYVGNKEYFTDAENEVFKQIQIIGNEFGTTTGRPRKVNWMNLDNILMAAQINGVTDVIINKVDVLEEINVFTVIHNNSVIAFSSYHNFRTYVEGILYEKTLRPLRVTWSKNPNKI